MFLIRLGKEPKGIIASGLAESNVFEDDHWDDEKYAAGESAFYVDVRFDNLLNPDNEAILPRQELNRLGNMHWDSQSSVIQIPDVVANRLENLWADFLNTDRFLPNVVAGLPQLKAYVLKRKPTFADGAASFVNLPWKRQMAFVVFAM